MLTDVREPFKFAPPKELPKLHTQASAIQDLGAKNLGVSPKFSGSHFLTTDGRLIGGGKNEHRFLASQMLSSYKDKDFNDMAQQASDKGKGIGGRWGIDGRNMDKLLEQTGMMRVSGNKTGINVDAKQPLTSSQRRVIMNHIEDNDLPNDRIFIDDYTPTQQIEKSILRRGESKANEEGTSDGAVKGWATRRAGGVITPVKEEITYATTVVQGMEYPVGKAVKNNWEKHTTREQRSDPNFATSFSDSIKNAYQSKGKPEQKEPEIKIEEPIAPEQRPQGDNYRIESGKALLEMKIESESAIVERLKERPDLVDMIAPLQDNIDINKEKLEKLLKEDPKDLPHIPMGKNTHTKHTDGMVHSDKTTIKIQQKVLSESTYALGHKIITTMWNNLPDDVRDKVTTLKIQRSLGQGQYKGGSFDQWKGTLILNINLGGIESLEHHFYHEIGHVKYDNMKLDKPEAVKKWIEACNKIGIAPTKYAEGHRGKHIKMMNDNNRYRRQQVRLGIPLTDDEKITMEHNEYLTKDIYENEIHSEMNAHAMGNLPPDQMTYGREFTNKFLEAFKELEEI